MWTSGLSTNRSPQPGFNPLGPCGGHARPACPVLVSWNSTVSIPSAPAGGMQAARGRDRYPTNATQSFNPLGPCGGHASSQSCFLDNQLEDAFQSPRPLRGACKPKSSGRWKSPSSRPRSFNPLGPCGGHASRVGEKPAGRRCAGVSIPSAPAGGMQGPDSGPDVEGDHRVSIPSAPAGGMQADREPRCIVGLGQGGFNPLGPCGGHARRRTFRRSRTMKAPGFNPLGPCGGHARVKGSVISFLSCSTVQFQSPRPLRGACKARVSSGPSPSWRGPVSIPSAPAGGMQDADRAYDRDRELEARFNPLGPCGGHARRGMGRGPPEPQRDQVSIPSAPAGGMQTRPAKKNRAAEPRSIPPTPAGACKDEPRLWCGALETRARVSIPSAPAGGMQEEQIKIKMLQLLMHKFQSPRPLRGACKCPH